MGLRSPSPAAAAAEDRQSGDRLSGNRRSGQRLQLRIPDRRYRPARRLPDRIAGYEGIRRIPSDTAEVWLRDDSESHEDHERSGVFDRELSAGERTDAAELSNGKCD